MSTHCGNETVNTMPDQTLEAVSITDVSGRPTCRPTRWSPVRRRSWSSSSLVSLATVTEKLERDGVDAFVTSYDECLAIVKEKIDVVRG